MTEQDIFNMARKAGFGEVWFEQAEPGYPARPREGILIGFARMVAAAEREECAELCDRFAERQMHPAECAAAIRARAPR